MNAHILQPFVLFSYHPALRRAREIVSSGELGATQSIDVKMSIPSFALKDDDIRFNYGLAGGTMMDLGKGDRTALHASSYNCTQPPTNGK